METSSQGAPLQQEDAQRIKVNHSDLGGSVDRIVYSNNGQSGDDTLSDELKNSAQARRHRQVLFYFLLCASSFFAGCFTWFIGRALGWVQLSIEAGIVNGEKVLGNSGTGWLLEVIAFLLASLIMMPLLAAQRMANREKETTSAQAKDFGIIISLLHRIISIISPK